jgi:hypothetical protein
LVWYGLGGGGGYGAVAPYPLPHTPSPNPICFRVTAGYQLIFRCVGLKGDPARLYIPYL